MFSRAVRGAYPGVRGILAIHALGRQGDARQHRNRPKNREIYRGANRCDGGRLRLDGGRVWWRAHVTVVVRGPVQAGSITAACAPVKQAGLAGIGRAVIYDVLTVILEFQAPFPVLGHGPDGAVQPLHVLHVGVEAQFGLPRMASVQDRKSNV